MKKESTKNINSDNYKTELNNPEGFFHTVYYKVGFFDLLIEKTQNIINEQIKKELSNNVLNDALYVANFIVMDADLHKFITKEFSKESAGKKIRILAKEDSKIGKKQQTIFANGTDTFFYYYRAAFENFTQKEKNRNTYETNILPIPDNKIPAVISDGIYVTNNKKQNIEFTLNNDYLTIAELTPVQMDVLYYFSQIIQTHEVKEINYNITELINLFNKENSGTNRQLYQTAIIDLFNKKTIGFCYTKEVKKKDIKSKKTIIEKKNYYSAIKVISSIDIDTKTNLLSIIRFTPEFFDIASKTNYIQTLIDAKKLIGNNTDILIARFIHEKRTIIDINQIRKNIIGVQIETRMQKKRFIENLQKSAKKQGFEFEKNDKKDTYILKKCNDV